MITAYFWKDNQVVPFTGNTYCDNVDSAGLFDYYCVDVSTTDHALRFGIYESDDCGDWKHIPLDQFPKEFLATLMIMGVPYG